MDDDYGLDTIEMGATVGVAMEAGLAERDVSGIVQVIETTTGSEEGVP